ncbi:hypothetical protein M758_3G203300 [Ceratodon purpureus]|uniref:SAM domain-containing protein n=1 Tax=Ceratodon purpureus TaxID=3225 RepID=A0A8T0IPH8_CERPU|nr:hypothetical protein KC19_3G203800 [Ceratodon purpureus]KAG0623799.1 hypothetical protein M758_3G203300 [Ceratodon purpureus]
MSGVIDPLQSVEEQKLQEETLETDKVHSPPLLPDQTSVVLQWSVEQVTHWLRHSVPAEPDRLQEICSNFVSEGVDGLSLLTLQRNHQACSSMTDQEWLLVKVARRWLMTQGERPLVSWPSRVKVKSTITSSTPPGTPQSARSDRSSYLRDYHDSSVSPRKQWKMPRIQWGKDDQEEALEREVQHLRGEIVAAEERETLHLAQLDHVDEVLRTSQLSSYLHTRTRWTALSGEPPQDDTDVDDWLLRFVVFRGSSICFFLRATDLRPQGTIMRSEIVEVGMIPNHLHHQGDTRWSAFHITTCHGLRLECSSLVQLQIDSWLSVINGGYNYGDLLRDSSPHIKAGEKNLQSAEANAAFLARENSLFGEVD